MKRTLELFPRAPTVPRARPTRAAAAVTRDMGIERAGDHADRERELWREEAANLIHAFARDVRKPFLIEDVRPYAAERGLGDPPDARAWGAATMLAKRSGAIVSCGFREARTSNLSPKVLWVLRDE